MGRSKNSGRRGLQRTANVITLPTRVPSLRITNRFSPVRSRVVSYDAWEQTESAINRAVGGEERRRRRLGPTRSRQIRLLEDRRYWHPIGPQRPARAWNMNAARVSVPTYAKLAGAAVTAKLAFAGPASVAICVRRSRRREVMFALRKGGRRGQRRPRRNWYSSIRCRR